MMVLVGLLLFSAAIGFLFALFRFNNPASDAEAWARGGLVAVSCLVILYLLKGIAGLWRAARRVDVDSVARTAGAITGAAQDRAATLAKAFKDGKKR